MTHRYDDIINLPHHVSQKHAPMTRADRAAQFSPFAALTGLDAALRETARLRIENPELSLAQLAALAEVSKSCLNHRLRKLVELANAPVQVPGEDKVDAQA